jgi:hypothetical protein
MASPNSTFTEMVTTTLRNHPSEVADNVSDNNAFYSRLRKKGNIKKISGGTTIVRPLDYADNATFQRYTGYDPLNVSASDVLSAAEYSWVQSAVHITASGRELRMNSGKEQIVNLAMARKKNAIRTAANNMSVDLYSSGALTNQMGGLGAVVTSDGTGTVGGIVSGTYTFWKNNFVEFTGTPGPTTIKGQMMLMWLELVRGGDHPDLIVFSHDFYADFWESLTDLQRYATTDEATVGFRSLKFLDADVIFDSNTNFAVTAKVGYFLNTDYLELVSHREADWTWLDEKQSINQDAVVIPVIWMGNLVCSNRSLQGKLIDES